MTFANNELFTGSLDHYVRIWDINSIDDKLSELELMAAEDLLSRKFRMQYRGAKKGKKGAKGKGGKGGKGKKKK